MIAFRYLPGRSVLILRSLANRIDMEQWPLTQKSLLVRIRDAGDHEAWCRFVDIYGPVLYQYALRQGLQDADAADLVQDVIRRVSAAIAEFRYDPSQGTFRGWLYTVARNSLRNFWALAGRREKGTGDSKFHKFLEQIPDEENEDSKVWEQEYERHLLMLAADRIKGSFSPATWQAFWQTAVEVKNVKEVAESLGMSVGAAYVAKSRVLARMRQEVERLALTD